MAGETLGTVRGQIILDVKQALASYTQARQAHISTVTALHTGAGAVQQAGAVIAAAGAVMVGGFVAALNAAGEFERKLDYFSAVADVTAEDYDLIRKKALQLGADTIYSAGQIADSFVELGKAGVSAQDIISGIGEGVASLAAAADIGLEQAAIILMSAVQTFGLGAEQAVDVADKLAGAANASIIEVEDLGISLKYAGGVAASLGISFDEVAQALALLGTYGIRGSTAGTSLRKMLISLSGATPKAIRELTDLGIILEDGSNRFFTAEGSAKSLAEIFQILQDATAGLTDEQKINSLNTIFQNRALASAIALTEQGAAGFETMAEAISKTTAFDVASTRLDNLSGDLEILRGNIETFVITAGSSFQNFARWVVQSITKVLQIFFDLPESVQTFIIAAAAIGGLVLLIVGVLGLFAGSVMNIIALTIQLKDAWVLLRGATQTATAAQWAFNAASFANPIGLIVALVLILVAALAALIIYWEEFSAWATSGDWTVLFAALSPIASLAVAFANIQKWMQDHQKEVDAFFGVVSGIWTDIVNFFSTIAQNIGQFVTDVANWFVDAFTNVSNFLSQVWNTIISGITGFIDSVITFFSELPNNISNFLQALPGMVVQFFTDMGNNIVTFFQELPGRLGYALGFILGTITRVILEIGNWLITNVPIIVNNVISFFAGLGEAIGQFFVDIYNNIVNWIQAAWDWLVTNVPLIIENFISFWQNLPLVVAQFLAELYTNVVTWITEAWNWLLTTVPQIINNVINFFAQLPGRIAGFFFDIYVNVLKWLTQAFNTVTNLARDIFNTIKDWLGKIPETVKNIFNNVVNTIKNVISSAIKAVTDFAKGLWEGFKKGLGINSPSYIEHAIWAITDTLTDETQKMKGQVRDLQTLSRSIPNMETGLSFGGSEGLANLYRAVKATKDLEAELALTPNLSSASNNQQLLTELLGEIAEKDTTSVNIENLNVENPVPEEPSETVPKAIRKTLFIAGE